MSHILISIPEEEYWVKMKTLIDSRQQIVRGNASIDAVTYSVNQVRIILKRGHDTVKRLVDAGLLKTTSDGRIKRSEVERYLESNS